jgi:tetratricopeptide (TPR) repeat protein
LTEKNPVILEITKHADALKSSVYEQRGFSPTVRRFSQAKVSFPQIHALCESIYKTLNHADKNGFLPAELFAQFKKDCQFLWDHLLSRNIKDALLKSSFRDLSVVLDEQLMFIPWELLYDGSNFLCLKFNLGRMIRTQKEELGQANYRGHSASLKMLVLANPTNDLKSAYHEGINIRNQFGNKNNEICVDFKSTHIDSLYVKKNMRDYDIVHFAGHCEYDQKDAKQSGWVLEDGRFTVRDITTLAESMPMPSLIFSNACYSSYNMACAFILSGVRHYIGTIRRMEDNYSFDFAREFYARLIDGYSVGEAIHRARTKIIHDKGILALSWASYILYGDNNFILFKKKPRHFSVKLKAKNIAQRLRQRNFLIELSLVLCLLFLGLSWFIFSPSQRLLFSKMQKLYEKGKNEEVVLLSQKILEAHPDFLQVYPILAQTYQRQGKRSKALQVYFDYILLSQKKDYKPGWISAYIEVGWIYQLLGYYEKAEGFYSKALALARENKDYLNEAVALRKLAVWNTEKGNYDLALELLLKSSEINRMHLSSASHRYNLACDYFDLGLVFANKNDSQAASDFYQKAKAILQGMNLKSQISDCYFNLGEIYLLEKQYSMALDYYKKGLEIDIAEGNLPSLSASYDMMGEFYLEIGDYKQAEASYLKAIEISSGIEAPLELAQSSYNLGNFYIREGRKNKAREYLRQAQEIYYRSDSAMYQKIKETLLNLSN